MGAFEDARAIVLIGDFINADLMGKLNALGACFSFTGLMANGHIGPNSVAALVEVPSRYDGQQCAITLELRDETTGSAVQVPTDVSGKTDTLRVSQVATFQRATVPGIILPANMPCRWQIALNFANGIPLTANHSYAWHLQIDGQHRKGWEAHFVVVGAPQPPVFGGPAGPADIPSIRLDEPDTD